MLSVTQGLAGCVVCRAVLVPREWRPRVHTSGTILRRIQSLVAGSRARELVGQVALGLDLERGVRGVLARGRQHKKSWE